MSEKNVPVRENQSRGSALTPDLSVLMPTYTTGKQFSELTERRAGQTRPLFEIRVEAAEKEKGKK